jgi:peptidoglycan hydrolase CwlO-like protein
MGLTNGNHQANGNRVSASTAALQERVVALVNDVREFRQISVELDRKIEQSYTNLSNRFETAVAAINTKIEERNKIPWSAVSTGVAVIIAIGGVAYLPIQTRQNDLGAEIETVRTSLDHIGDVVVPRKEHELEWANSAVARQDLKETINSHVANLQRQIDELNKKVGDTYTTRDILLEEQKQIDDLERAVKAPK